MLDRSRADSGAEQKQREREAQVVSDSAGAAPLLIWYGDAPAETPFVDICGLSAIERAVLTAIREGFTRVRVAVHAADAHRARQELGERAEVVVAADLEAKLSDMDASEIVIARGSRVWLGPAFRAMLAPLDPRDDARRLESQEEGAEASGLVRLRREHVARVERLDGLQVAHDRVRRACWAGIDDQGGMRRAERMLLRSLIKPIDGVISRHINRKMSLALSRRLVRYDIRPNHVTVFVLLIGIASGPLAMMGTYLGFALGALAYYVSAVLDGVDGELARLKFMGTPAGAWFDTVTDDIVGLSWLIGMYVGLARSHAQPYWWIIGWVAVLCYLCTILPRYYLLITRVGVADHRKLAADARSSAPPTGLSAMLHALRETVFRTDFLPFYALVTAAVGVVPAFAIPYAVGSVAAMIDTSVAVARLSRPRTEGGSPAAS